MKKSPFKVSALIIILLFSMCNLQNPPESTTEQPPAWAKDVIWYQIFVERFHNGDPNNDPKPENLYAASNYREVPVDWSITPWTDNWYIQEDWTTNLNTDFYGGLGLRRFGGDLQGVMDK